MLTDLFNLQIIKQIRALYPHIRCFLHVFPFKLQVAFPELTLCPSEPYREEQLKIHGIASRFEQIQGAYIPKGS